MGRLTLAVQREECPRGKTDLQLASRKVLVRDLGGVGHRFGHRSTGVPPPFLQPDGKYQKWL